MIGERGRDRPAGRGRGPGRDRGPGRGRPAGPRRAAPCSESVAVIGQLAVIEGLAVVEGPAVIGCVAVIGVRGRGRGPGRGRAAGRDRRLAGSMLPAVEGARPAFQLRCGAVLVLRPYWCPARLGAAACSGLYRKMDCPGQASRATAWDEYATEGVPKTIPKVLRHLGGPACRGCTAGGRAAAY